MWENIKINKSSDECVSKLVFTTHNAIAEAVLYRYPTYRERTVICCSVQSGCPMGCTFCGTGDFFVRNLTSQEIVNQVVECLKVAHQEEGTYPFGIEKFQIMFMSMGEPMMNWPNVRDAIKVLNAMYPDADLLVSTVAPKNSYAFYELNNLSKEIDKVGLQFSIHESTDAKRDLLIPTKNKMNLWQIREHGLEWAITTGRRPFFNYCVHKDNCSDRDISNLVSLFPPHIWECTLSVICESDQTVQCAIDDQLQRIQKFSEDMIMSGYNVRVFNPAGQDDIGGGCGQLWEAQQWVFKNRDIVYFGKQPDELK